MKRKKAIPKLFPSTSTENLQQHRYVQKNTFYLLWNQGNTQDNTIPSTVCFPLPIRGVEATTIIPTQEI